MYLPTVIGYLVPTYPPVTEVRHFNIHVSCIFIELYQLCLLFIIVLVGT